MIVRIAIITILGVLPLFGQGQTNISYTQNSTGGVSFALFGGTLPANTTVSNVIWEFGDGWVVSGGTYLYAYHQYGLTGLTYTVEVSYVMDVSGTITNEVDTTSITTSDWSTIETCPVVIFNYNENDDWCGTGELTLDLSACYNGTDWTLDHTDWNMGDGTVITTQGNYPVVHNYQNNATVAITAVAYFTGSNGETCSSIVLHADSINDACDLVLFDTPGSGIPFLELAAPYAQPDLYINAGNYCQTDQINFFDAGVTLPSSNNLHWSYEVFVDGTSVSTSSGLPASNPTSFFNATLPAGDHLIELVYTYDYNDRTCSVADGLVVTVDSCGRDTCETCNAFRPEPDERYWVSAWVKEAHPNQVKTYTDAHIRLSFSGGTPLDVDFFPTGEIIEGWQRIVGSFTIPVGSTTLELDLKNDGAVDAFFDDIRFHPFNGSFKSYVYDPVTLWLTAELDDNNYATFYEYDQEGQLIRIKKETSRGIMTIQESSSSNPKSE